MRNIEKALKSYVKDNGPKPSKEILVSLAENDADSLINILFCVIEDELYYFKGKIRFDKIRELLKDIFMILGISNTVNRKIVSRRLNHLSDKIENIQTEGKKRIYNPEKAKLEFQTIKSEIEHLAEQAGEKDNKQYDFMKYLIEEIQNISYLEYTLNKLPKLASVKDKDGNSLFQNIIKKYIDSIIYENKERFYYRSVISLILSGNSFKLTDVEKSKVLNFLYHSIERMNNSKVKVNKEGLQEVKDLVETIKVSGAKSDKIEQLSKKYNIPIHFSEPIHAQLRWKKNPWENTFGRREVDDFIITIDKEGAVEIDDALSCKKLPNGNYLLGVHIASALGYFPYESPIVDEALKRSRSIYLPKKYQNKENDFRKVIPMFPYEFAANKGSLVEQVPKLARSYYYEISEDGEIVKEQFFKSIIKSNKKMSYREIDRILKNGSKDPRLQELVMNLREVTEALDKRYHPKALYEQIKEYTEDYSELRVKRTGAEKIVYQAMLLTGNRVANYFADSKRGYPCLYRVLRANEEDSRKLQAMIDNLTKTYGGQQYQKLYQLVNGIYPKGWYDTSGAHDGLGLDHYCHCTSTLRRAADIVVEHALEVCYDKEPSDKELIQLEEEINKRSSEINAKQEPIDCFVKDFKRAYQKKR